MKNRFLKDAPGRIAREMFIIYPEEVPGRIPSGMLERVLERSSGSDP